MVLMIEYSEYLKIIDKINKCKRCNLSKTKLNYVPGEGSIKSKIMFIGEAPGRNEDKQGIPFVGRAGKILDDLLNNINLDRNEIFITNILKCRPPKNRNPTREEIESCVVFLERQLELINPKVIVTLGNFATKYILEKFGFKTEKIGLVHGYKFKINNKDKIQLIIPLFHPAAMIYNRKLKDYLLNDFQKIRDLL
jgi:DNA polymerase